MPFRFALQNYLNLRETFEEQAAIALEAINQKVTAIIAEIESFKQYERQAEEALLQQMQHGASGAELHLAIFQSQNRASSMDEKLKELEALRVEQRQKTLAYQNARKDRKILESLKEKQAEDYRIAEGRREEQRISDLVAMTTRQKRQSED